MAGTPHTKVLRENMRILDPTQDGATRGLHNRWTMKFRRPNGYNEKLADLARHWELYRLQKVRDHSAYHHLDRQDNYQLVQTSVTTRAISARSCQHVVLSEPVLTTPTQSCNDGAALLRVFLGSSCVAEWYTTRDESPDQPSIFNSHKPESCQREMAFSVAFRFIIAADRAPVSDRRGSAGGRREGGVGRLGWLSLIHIWRCRRWP